MRRSLEYLVLRSLVETPDNACGAVIARRTGIVGGVVYTVLGRLEEKDQIAGIGWSTPDPIRGGRQRRLYAITNAGKAALQKKQRAFGTLRAAP